MSTAGAAHSIRRTVLAGPGLMAHAGPAEQVPQRRAHPVDAEPACPGPGQHQQVLGQPRQPVGFFRCAPQGGLQLVRLPRPRQGEVQLRLQDAERGAQLVAGVIQQPLLPLDRVLQPVQQRVQGPAEPGHLVVGARHRQPAAQLGDRDRGCLAAHALHGPQRGPGEQPRHQAGQGERGRAGRLQQQPQAGQRLADLGQGGADHHVKPVPLGVRQHERPHRRVPRCRAKVHELRVRGSPAAPRRTGPAPGTPATSPAGRPVS